VSEALLGGLVYVADSDARAVGTAHPSGNVWDNGADAVASLKEVMAVRRHALDNFGLDRVRAGQAVADLKNVFVPIYLYHRYQLAAAGKLIGGMSFNYSVSGDGQAAAQIVPAFRQKTALQAILQTLDASLWSAIHLPIVKMNSSKVRPFRLLMSPPRLIRRRI